MAFALNDEERLLKQTAKSFLQEKAPVKSLRELRDSRDETGFSRALWREMAELGWAGIAIPEEYGGFDYGYTGLGIVLEESGRTLAASPLVSTVLLGATAVALGGNQEQKREILPAVASGELLLSLALEEQSRHAPTRIALSATRNGAGFILEGSKLFVLDGHVADKFVVAARTSGPEGAREGITLFLVDAHAPGVKSRRVIMVDSRNAAQVSFHNVSLPAEAVLGEVNQGYPLLEKVLDIGRIGLAAEMLGSAREAFERTMAYLKERKQFGVPIGSFQALQHRAARMFCEIELCQSLISRGLTAVDEGEDALLPLLASAAKAKVCEMISGVTNEAVQMFGGMGMTDEQEIGLFLKRARVAQQTLGDRNYHIDRFATLKGY